MEDMRAIPAYEISSPFLISNPKVSIIMLAYNHEKYIAKAISSIISQDNLEQIELLIGEDCSNDKTRLICQEFQQNYPKVIRIITAEKNVGAHKNFFRLWCRARSEYLAFCEGDDYWIDTKKLNKQIYILDKNINCSLCGAYTQIINEENGDILKTLSLIKPLYFKENYKLIDLIPNYNFHTSSIVLRKSSVELPSWLWNVYCTDRPLYLLATQNNKIAICIPEIMSIYRQHLSGVWSQINFLEKAHRSIHLFHVLEHHLEKKYSKIFRNTIGNIIWYYATESLEMGDTKMAKILFWKSFCLKFLYLKISDYKLVIGILLKLYFPLVYQVHLNFSKSFKINTP